VQNVLSFSFLSKNIKIKIHRTTILPVVLYGCETLSLPLREEHRLRVFGNRLLRYILGPKRDKVAENGEVEEIHDLYSSPPCDQIKTNVMDGAVHHKLETGDMNTWFWWGDLRERNHLENLGIGARIKSKWIFQEVGWGGMDWINLTQDRDRWLALVNVVMNEWVQPIERNF
jgi:hypothetical protein